MNQSSTTTHQERVAFRQHVAQFTQSLIASWGESKPTHDMVGGKMTNALFLFLTNLVISIY